MMVVSDILKMFVKLNSYSKLNFEAALNAR
jgi:hypothetical protein